MTREEAMDNMELIKAFASGKEILLYTYDYNWVHVDNFEINGGIYVINDNYVEFRKAEALGDVIEYYFCGEWRTKDKSYSFDCMGDLRIRESFIPKQGDNILVSDSPDRGFHIREFITMTKDMNGFVCHSPNGTVASSWKYAKPIGTKKAKQ